MVEIYQVATAILPLTSRITLSQKSPHFVFPLDSSAQACSGNLGLVIIKGIKIMEKALFLLLLVLFSKTTTSATTGSIDCKAGHFLVGEKASVSCFFPVDVSNKIYDYHIIVEFDPASPQNKDTRDILNCPDVVHCEAKDNFHLSSNITDRLKLDILNVTSDFVGNYSCQLVPPNGYTKSSCFLSVDETKKTADSKCIFPGKEEHGPGQVAGENIWYILLTVILVAGLIASIVCNVLQKRGCNRLNDSEKGIPKQGTGEFCLRNWVKKMGLPKNVQKALSHEHLTSIDKLRKLKKQEIQLLPLTQGNKIRLTNAVNSLRETGKKAERDKEFHFDVWVKDSQLCKGIKKALERHDMTHIETLMKAEEDDIAALGLKRGDVPDLENALKSLRDTRGRKCETPDEDPTNEDNDETTTLLGQNITSSSRVPANNPAGGPQSPSNTPTPKTSTAQHQPLTSNAALVNKNSGGPQSLPKTPKTSPSQPANITSSSRVPANNPARGPQSPSNTPTPKNSASQHQQSTSYTDTKSSSRVPANNPAGGPQSPSSTPTPKNSASQHQRSTINAGQNPTAGPIGSGMQGLQDQGPANNYSGHPKSSNTPNQTSGPATHGGATAGHLSTTCTIGAETTGLETQDTKSSSRVSANNPAGGPQSPSSTPTPKNSASQDQPSTINAGQNPTAGPIGSGMQGLQDQELDSKCEWQTRRRRRRSENELDSKCEWQTRRRRRRSENDTDTTFPDVPATEAHSWNNTNSTHHKCPDAIKRVEVDESPDSSFNSKIP